MWTHPAIECMLTEVRKRKALYDQRHADYLNREKRRTHLETICNVIYDKEGLEVTVDDVKAKFQVLRSQLNKELRYMARSNKYKPKLWCFKKMEFLKPYCGTRSHTPYPSNNNTHNTASGNGQPKVTNKTPKNSVDQIESMSRSTFEADIPSSSNILTSKEMDMEINNDFIYPEIQHDVTHDMNQEFYDTIALTQQIVQNRIASKSHKVDEATSDLQKQSSWEGELVRSQLELITDETIRNDTMWEIQCVLRRGIERDRVLPTRRRNNRRSSLAISEVSADGSCISLDSNESVCKNGPTPGKDNNI